MRFKASLQAPFYGGKLDGKDSILKFTKSQIIFPSDRNTQFQDASIKNEAYYKLVYKDSIRRNERYQIEINGINHPIRLGVTKLNEIKLKLLHGLYPFQKDATAATIIAILALLLSLIGMMR